MVDFARLAATAKRLIEENGRLVTLYRRERTPDDPGKPWRGPGPAPPEATLGPVRVAFVPPSGAGLGSILADESGKITRRISQVGLLAADSVAALSPPPAELDVKLYDSLDDGTTTLRIARVETLQPADETLIYALGIEA